MKYVSFLTLPSLLLTTLLSAPVWADDMDPSGDQINKNTKELSEYLLHLGKYFGYNLKDAPPEAPYPLTNVLTSTTKQQLKLAEDNAQQNNQLSFYNIAFDVFLGSIPVNALFSTFVPSKVDTSNLMNPFANVLFGKNYANPNQGGSTGISVNSAVDEPKKGPYQQDPVSQSVLNILGTPDVTYCMNYPAEKNTYPSQWEPKDPNECAFMTNYNIKSNVIGELPSTKIFFTSDYNQSFLSQLNSNTLIAPLLYSTEDNNANSTSSTPASNNNNSALKTQNQAQEAASFIRYASGAVSPLTLPSQKDYDTLLSLSKSSNTMEKVQAQDLLATYLTKLRVYAAQLSVGYSNLYYMLSKRLPQDMSIGNNNVPPTSQALNEFTMATWRLYNPNGSSSDWLNQINHASSITIQKEMVTLLAEINYQLYLTRQQQERLLLTNTMLLFMGSNMTQPTVPTEASVVKK